MKLSDLNILEVGNTIQLAGAIYASGDTMYLVPLPHELTSAQEAICCDLNTRDGAASFQRLREASELVSNNPVKVLEMALPEWEVFIRQTDLLEVEVKDTDAEGKVAKAILRKSQRQIDQGVSWRVWKRDGYCCRYCGIDGVPMTVDHLVLWEDGGPSIEANLVTACRKCNKVRGSTPYAEWLRHPHYKKASRNLITAAIEANEALVATLPGIPRVKHIKSR